MTLDFSQTEAKILKFWEKNEIFEKLRKKNQNNKSWSFLDGPITANNPMGAHHGWGRTYKDLFQRFKAMRGYNQRFQNGFDCQGLWVEVEVEKELGFKTKKDIEKFGIDKFVEKCKERVIKYAKIQTEQSIRLGQWMDWENSYYTMSDENNYAIWHFLKKCRERGELYKGKDVVPWCQRCGTAISQHEILTEEYKEISHKAIFVKLPIIGRKNTFFLAWTTTPWTLPANVALAVNPKFEYVEIKDGNDDTFIISKSKADLISDGKIIKKFLGKNLEGLKYQGMFDELGGVQQIVLVDNLSEKGLRPPEHKIILWNEVSEEEGTGIVHIAPGCGQEDYQLSKDLELDVVDPLDEESRYKPEFGFLSGKSATEANNLIFENLKEKALVYKIADYPHRYPTCWRCKSELIFRLVDEWYISMEKLRKPLMETAKKIKWLPSFGLERELDWLKNMSDWLISKKRYWGLALPIFECPCGNFEVIGSKEELKQRTAKGWEEFEGHSPHRPWVDKIKIRCGKCGKLISRIPDVGNPWLDAGIVPFSTMGYFSDKNFWEKWFPAELVCESFPGQFKNWFYSIIVMAAVLENAAPVKTIFGYASVRDEKDEEMHKSKGNAIWFDEAIEKIGADTLRWMYARQNPASNLKFGWKAADETKRKLLTLWNGFVFFRTYVDKKEFPVRSAPVKTSHHILDRWIISRLQGLMEKTTGHLEKYNAASASSIIEEFWTDDLSLWYIRRSRRRFQQPENKKEKEQAAGTLYRVLLDLTKLMAPMTPFLAEETYQELNPQTSEQNSGQSVHLENWPKADKNLRDKELEKKMEEARRIIALALAERMAAGIKVRQPLNELRIMNYELKEEKELLELIKEEINVKKIVFDAKMKKQAEIDKTITRELKEEGTIREVVRNIQRMRKELGLKPVHKIAISFSAVPEIEKLLLKNKKLLLKETKAETLKPLNESKAQIFSAEKNIKVGEQKLYLAITKL